MSSISLQTPNSNASYRTSLIQNMIILGEVASTETALFHQTAAATFGLGITDMKALSVLLQEGAMPAGKLSERLRLTTGAVTNVIDRLEHKGYVKRKADVKDRRKVVVIANKQRLRRQQYVYDSMGKAFSQQLEQYSTDELEFLSRYYQNIIELTKKEIDKAAKQ